MNSRGRFVIEGIRQAGKVFVASLLLVVLVAGPIWMIGLDQIDKGAISGPILIVCYLVAVVFGSILAGPIPLLLINFDISNACLLALSFPLLFAYWALLGTLAGLGRRHRYAQVGQLQIDVTPKRISRQIRLLVELMAVTIAILLFTSGPFIYHPSRGNHFEALVITQHLRDIKSAKEKFALEHQPTADYIPTETDLTPYLSFGDGKIPQLGCERYVINTITNSPYAILTKSWWEPRHGWQEGHLVGTNGTIFRLPETPPGK